MENDDERERLRWALCALQQSLPHTGTAYREPTSGWLAQRIVGAAAVAESRIVAARSVPANPPPALPASVPAFGGDWITAAKTWNEVAETLYRYDAAALEQTADRLREYAASQLDG